MNKDLTGQVDRLKVSIFLLTTNLSWWLMKQKNINRFNGFSFIKSGLLVWTQIKKTETSYSKYLTKKSPNRMNDWDFIISVTGLLFDK